VRILNQNKTICNFKRPMARIKSVIFGGLAALVLSGLAATGASAQASNVYLTPDGGGSGVCTNNVHTPSWFNNSANWGSGTSQIGPGTVVHLCGNFTGAANGNLLSFQGNGTSGHPVTILFESGAILSAPYFSFSGAINMDNRSFVTVDGGTGGLIQNTDNGSNKGNKQSSTGISAGSCSNCEIRNLTVANIYVHVPNETSVDQTNVIAIIMSGPNWLVHDNVIHDCGWCVRNFYRDGDTNVKVYNNNIYNADHGYIPAGNGNISASNFYFYNNHVHDYAVWDTGTADSFHHDGVHAFGVAGANLTNLQIYNNTFDGATGGNFTSHIYVEHPDNSAAETNPLVYNNILDGTKEPAGNFGLLAIGDISGAQAYNNTIVGPNNNGAYCVLAVGGSVTFKNNVISGCWAGFFFYRPTSTVTMNNNVYANQGSCGIGYSSAAVCYPTIAEWRTFTGQEPNSQYATSAGLDSNFHPQTGSAVIGASANLFSLGVAGLEYDKSGAARKSSGAWDTGAYLSGSSTTAVPPVPPSGLTAIVH
jgi:hypothetical protein